MKKGEFAQKFDCSSDVQLISGFDVPVSNSPIMSQVKKDEEPLSVGGIFNPPKKMNELSLGALFNPPEKMNKEIQGIDSPELFLKLLKAMQQSLKDSQREGSLTSYQYPFLMERPEIIVDNSKV